MTDWTQEEDEAFNDVEKHSNLGKQILREIGQPYHFEKREWVGLTDEDRLELAAAQYGWEDLLTAAEAKLKEKNEKT
jgi:hypothetical protein